MYQDCGTLSGRAVAEETKPSIYGYGDERQGYRFNEDVANAYGIIIANPQFGNGGPQYYDPNVQELIDKGILAPIDNIKLQWWTWRTLVV